MSDEETDDIEVRYLAANGYDYHAALIVALRELTQAREALERIAEDDPVWFANTVSSYKAIARQALATINREGETS